MSAARIFSDLRQALANLRAQKTRTMLTALGIVFGVGSVIGMLAIGAGAREESLRFIEQLGVRNVLVESRPATSQEELQQRRRSSPGLTERDVRILEANIEALEMLSPRAHAASRARAAQARRATCPSCTACGPSYAAIHNLRIGRGPLLRRRARRRPAPPCACSARAPRSTCSATAPAVGKFVKVNDTWLEVVGVLRRADRRRRRSRAAARCRT